MFVVFLGAPGAGKGTHAGFLSSALQVPIVSTGNLLREAIRQGTPLGLQVKETVESGNLVPDAVSAAIMREKLTSDECRNGAIIDGFPRTLAQAEALDGICEVDAVISLEVPDQVLIDRMSGRRTCPQCQRSYHVQGNPPKVSGICDACGTGLTVREDDEAAVVLNRFTVYHARTEPIKAYYEAQGKLLKVDGHDGIEAVCRRVFAALHVEEPT